MINNLPDIKGGWMYTIGKVDPSAKSMIFHKMALKHNPSILPNPEKVRKSLAEMYPKMSKREQELYDRFRVPDCECTWNRFVKMPFKDRPKKKRRKSTMVLPPVFGGPTNTVQQTSTTAVQTTSQPVAVNLVAANAINGQVPATYTYQQPQQPQTYAYPQRPVPKPPAPPPPPKLYSAAAIRIKCVNHVYMLADYDLLGENKNPQSITTDGEIQFIIRPSNDGDDNYLRHMLFLMLGMQNADLETASQFGKEILDSSNDAESLYYEFMGLYNSSNTVMASYLHVVYAYMLRTQHGFYLEIVPSDKKVVSIVSPGAGLAKVQLQAVYDSSYIPSIGLTEEDVNKKIHEVEQKYKKQEAAYNAQVQKLEEAVANAERTILERDDSLKEAEERYEELNESQTALKQSLVEKYQKDLQELEEKYDRQFNNITASGNKERRQLQENLNQITAERDRLAAKLEEVEMTLQELQRGSSGNGAKIVSLTSELELEKQKYAEEVSKLQQQISEKELRYNTLLGEKKALEDHISSLKEDIEDKTQTIQANETTIAQLTESQKALQDEIAELKKEYARQGRLNKDQTARLNELTLENAKLEQNLKATKEDKARIEQQLGLHLNEKSREVERLENLNGELSEEQERLKAQVARLQSQITGLNEELQGKQAEVQRQIQEINDLKSSNAAKTSELQKRIEELEQKVSGLEQELGDLSDTKAEIDQQLSDAQRDNAVLSAAKAKLENDLAQSQQDYTGTKSDYDRLKAQYDEVVAAQNASQQQISALKTLGLAVEGERDSARAERDSARADLDDLRATLKSVRGELAKQKTKTSTLESANQTLEKTKKELEDQIRKKDNQIQVEQSKQRELNRQIEELKDKHKQQREQERTNLQSQFLKLLQRLPALMVQEELNSEDVQGVQDYVQFIKALRETYFERIRVIGAKLEQEYKEKEAKINVTLNQRTADLEKAQAKLEEERVSAEKVQQQAATELAQLKSQLESLQRDYQSVEQQLQDKSGLEQQISGLKEELANATANYKELERQHGQALAAHAEALQRQQGSYNEALQRQQGSYNVAMQQAESAYKAIQKAKEDQQRLFNEAAQKAESDIQTLAREKNAALATVQQLQAQLNTYGALDQEVTTLRAEKASMDKSLHDLEGQVQQLTKQIQEANNDPIGAIASVNTKLDLTSSSSNPISIITGFMCSPVVEEQFRALSELYDLETIGKIQLANTGNFLRYVSINTTRGFYIRAYPNLFKLLQFIATINKSSSADFIVATRLCYASLIFLHQILETQKTRNESTITDTFVNVFWNQFKTEVADKLANIIRQHDVFKDTGLGEVYVKFLNGAAGQAVPLNTYDYASSFVIITEMVTLCDRYSVMAKKCDNRQQYEDLFMLSEFGIYAFLNKDLKATFFSELMSAAPDLPTLACYVLRDLSSSYTNSTQDYHTLLAANTLESTPVTNGKRIENAAIEEFNRQMDENPYIKRGIEIAAAGFNGNKATATFQMVNAIKAQIIEVLTLSMYSRNALMGHNLEREVQSKNRSAFVPDVKLEQKISKENSFPVEVVDVEVPPSAITGLLKTALDSHNNLAFTPTMVHKKNIISLMTAEMISSPDPADRALLSLNSVISLNVSTKNPEEYVQVFEFTKTFKELYPDLTPDGINNAVSGIQKNSKIYYADLLSRLKPGLLSQRLTDSQGDKIAYSVGCAEQSDYFSKINLLEIGKDLEENEESETKDSMVDEQAKLKNSKLLADALKSINDTSVIANIAALSTVLCYLQKEVSTKPRIALMA